MEENQFKFYTVKEAAEILRTTPYSIYKHVKSGAIKGVHAGGKILISQDAIKKLVNE